MIIFVLSDNTTERILTCYLILVFSLRWNIFWWLWQYWLLLLGFLGTKLLGRQDTIGERPYKNMRKENRNPMIKIVKQGGG